MKTDESEEAATAQATWQIEVTEGSGGPEGSSTRFVGAHTLDVVGGALVFRDAAGGVTEAYAASEWRTVSKRLSKKTGR